MPVKDEIDFYGEDFKHLRGKVTKIRYKYSSDRTLFDVYIYLELIT